jgi:hypothetical protein
MGTGVSEGWRVVGASKSDRVSRSTTTGTQLEVCDLRMVLSNAREGVLRGNALEVCSIQFSTVFFPLGEFMLIVELLDNRLHVDRDFKPYICVSELCDHPDRGFTSFKNWYDHMSGEHGRTWYLDAYPPLAWVCMLPECEMGSKVFDTPTELHHHLEMDHGLTKIERDAIVHQSKIRRAPENCPMCCLPVEGDITAEKGQTSGKRGQDSQSHRNTLKRARSLQNPPGTREQVTDRSVSSDRTIEPNCSHSEMMARHIASHLQNIMMVLIRLMKVYELGGENVSDSSQVGRTTAASDNASSRRGSLIGPMSLPSVTSYPETEVMDLDAETVPLRRNALHDLEQATSPNAHLVDLEAWRDGLNEEVRDADISVVPSDVGSSGNDSYEVSQSDPRLFSDKWESLENGLDRAMIYRPNHRDGFIPRGKLETLVNSRAVENELTKLGSAPAGRSIRSWAEVICGEPSSSALHMLPPAELDEDSAGAPASRTYRKIFAILVLMNKVASIFDFIREQVSDEDLPLLQYIPPEEMPGDALQLRRRNDATSPARCFAGWRNYHVRAFFGDQWAMVAPFFARGDRRSVRHYLLADGDIMPFTYDSRDESGPGGQGTLERGGFGEVFKVRIHHDHHNFEGKNGFKKFEKVSTRSWAPRPIRRH